MDTPPAGKTPSAPQARAFNHRPEGLFAYAGQYLEAAQLLHDAGAKVGIPALSSLGQAIELLAKAFLHYRGVSEERLSRRPFGHDLEGCLQEASKLGLGLSPSLDEEEALGALSELYLAKELHYLFEYEKRLPDFDVLSAFAKRLQARVFDQVSSPYWAGEAAPIPAPERASEIVLHLIEDATAAKSHFQTWWALANRAYPDFLKTMRPWQYVEFFHASRSGHYKLIFIALSRIFDRDPRTAGVRELRRALREEGRVELESRLAQAFVPLELTVAKIMRIRNMAIAHNQRSLTRAKVYEQNDITPNQIRQVIDVACELVNFAAAELGLSNRVFYGERLEKATLAMLETLEKGRQATNSSAD